MRLLFDQNLSFRLLKRLDDIFPSAQHVRDIGLGSADDERVWAYAEEHGLVIVSKDGDFHQRAILLGAPPKIVWLRLGNCPTREIERVLRKRAGEIGVFVDDPGAALLVIDRLSQNPRE